MTLRGYIAVLRRDRSAASFCDWRVDTCVFGSDPACDVIIKLNSVKPFHCKLQSIPDGRAFIENFAFYRPETILNGIPLSGRTFMPHDSLIGIGGREFRFFYPKDSPWILKSMCSDQQDVSRSPLISVDPLPVIDASSFPVVKAVTARQSPLPITRSQKTPTLSSQRRGLSTKERYGPTPPRPVTPSPLVRVKRHSSANRGVSSRVPNVSYSPLQPRQARKFANVNVFSETPAASGTQYIRRLPSTRFASNSTQSNNSSSSTFFSLDDENLVCSEQPSCQADSIDNSDFKSREATLSFDATPKPISSVSRDAKVAFTEPKRTHANNDSFCIRRKSLSPPASPNFPHSYRSASEYNADQSSPSNNDATSLATGRSPTPSLRQHMKVPEHGILKSSTESRSTSQHAVPQKRARSALAEQRVTGKSVKFGPKLSPEQFDHRLPPSTPVKRGALPPISSIQKIRASIASQRRSMSRRSSLAAKAYGGSFLSIESPTFPPVCHNRSSLAQIETVQEEVRSSRSGGNTDLPTPTRLSSKRHLSSFLEPSSSTNVDNLQSVSTTTATVGSSSASKRSRISSPQSTPAGTRGSLATDFADAENLPCTPTLPSYRLSQASGVDEHSIAQTTEVSITSPNSVGSSSHVTQESGQSSNSFSQAISRSEERTSTRQSNSPTLKGAATPISSESSQSKVLGRNKATERNSTGSIGVRKVALSNGRRSLYRIALQLLRSKNAKTNCISASSEQDETPSCLASGRVIVRPSRSGRRPASLVLSGTNAEVVRTPARKSLCIADCQRSIRSDSSKPKSKNLGKASTSKSLTLPLQQNAGGAKMLRTPPVVLSPRITGLKTPSKASSCRSLLRLSEKMSASRSPKLQVSPDLLGVGFLFETPRSLPSPRLSSQGDLVKTPSLVNTLVPTICKSVQISAASNSLEEHKQVGSPRLSGIIGLLSSPAALPLKRSSASHKGSEDATVLPEAASPTVAKTPANTTNASAVSKRKRVLSSVVKKDDLVRNRGVKNGVAGSTLVNEAEVKPLITRRRARKLAETETAPIVSSIVTRGRRRRELFPTTEAGQHESTKPARSARPGATRSARSKAADARIQESSATTSSKHNRVANSARGRAATATSKTSAKKSHVVTTRQTRRAVSRAGGTSALVISPKKELNNESPSQGTKVNRGKRKVPTVANGEKEDIVVSSRSKKRVTAGVKALRRSHSPEELSSSVENNHGKKRSRVVSTKALVEPSTRRTRSTVAKSSTKVDDVVLADSVVPTSSAVKRNRGARSKVAIKASPVKNTSSKVTVASKRPRQVRGATTRPVVKKNSPESTRRKAAVAVADKSTQRTRSRK
ncbi:unnamed protein product [Mesocestoides corti]|uniref:PP1-binding domain-containing protein n=1 Tax=Mesocestoides corti TaxID=53468 RepID=A0A0R3U3R2_MESCO|nr:unnamed protein product [Mesocestoides corti]